MNIEEREILIAKDFNMCLKWGNPRWARVYHRGLSNSSLRSHGRRGCYPNFRILNGANRALMKEVAIRERIAVWATNIRLGNGEERDVLDLNL